MREAEHLREIAHRAFTTVILPVGVGDKADGGIEGEVRSNGRHACRIEGQQSLNPQQDIENKKATDMEEEHPDRVRDPILLAGFVDAA
jgi:hypothetical protein